MDEVATVHAKELAKQYKELLRISYRDLTAKDKKLIRNNQVLYI